MATKAPVALLQSTNQQRPKGNVYWSLAVKNLLLVPVFPLLGYVLMDQTGVSQALINCGLIPKAILGEGFGHVGLCFSIHYLAAALQCLWKGFRLSWNS
ncbi:MAG TPA: hypothetical protein V6C99_02380 [Oculatellaceae cyanobacterium]|jgi:hypothetical protein